MTACISFVRAKTIGITVRSFGSFSEPGKLMEQKIDEFSSVGRFRNYIIVFLFVIFLPVKKFIVFQRFFGPSFSYFFVILSYFFLAV